jgi:Phosphatidylserine/phosphatidylglycerophosphate/cardiolipin synthases and related enzymes
MKSRYIFWKNLTSCIIFLALWANLVSADTNVLFSPNGGCQDAIVSEINKAQKTIDIAMYYLTSREIAVELVKAKDRNIIIRIVLDKSQEIQKFSKSRYLIKRGFEVKYHTGSGIMHNKFALIDNKVLITGSFNWTSTADQKNEENLLIMTDEELIKKYQKRFEYLWQRGRLGKIKEDQGNEE